MYSIGIRVLPTKKTPKIYYAVVKIDGDEFEVVRNSFLNIPVSIDVPEQLAFIRTNFLAIILEFEVTHAGLRISESIAQTPSVYRMHIEGVIQELFANSSIQKYSVLKIPQMSRLLEDKHIKDYIEAKKIFAEDNDWKSYKQEERESILASVASSCL
ncbi:hypothetical protein MUN88_17120 [Gracilibacillus caseinilyticus]|uniref:Uncharacterized protein n=1 Tax=Gracilibacillus caseinilyticus TaxID=2932256 RepID=A0ABY4ETK5_9BACI|nr:hypothetical protein [Gracilibacillus caseinilyticus]UOQ47754.1 hypothetical protein MUN88_17120 [Gracilibacillus caseinilyticus]